MPLFVMCMYRVGRLPKHTVQSPTVSADVPPLPADEELNCMCLYHRHKAEQ